MWTWKQTHKVLEHGYRSNFEKRLAEQLEESEVGFEYEREKLRYVVPARNATYTPDFFLSNGIIIEAKGRFRTAEDRQKLILVKEAHPDIDLRLLFQTHKTPIYKGSPTTYADWAEKHGFQWASKRIPDTWLKK